MELTHTLAAVLLLAALAPAAPSAGQWHERTHRLGDASRDYRLYLPGSYDGSTRLPLLVMLHGCTQTAADFAAGTRMHRLAEERGFLVVFPEQPASAHPQRCWSWYDPSHQGRGAGEPALIAGIAGEVAREFAVDPDRVYLAGVSAGGAMAVNVAASYPERFAALGVHSGVPFGAAREVAAALGVMRDGPGDLAAATSELGARLAGRSLPMIVFHGAADAVVDPANGEALAAQWAEVQGSSTPVPVELRMVPGLGHAWSGGAAEGSYTDPSGPDASREIAGFLLAHRRGSPPR